jgi:3-oxoacyl-[acyl-carrier protein] reductase
LDDHVEMASTHPRKLDMGSRLERSGTNAAESLIDFEPGRHLVGRTVIITGAGSGIGAATSILFANHGANVVLCDIDEKGAQATSDFIQNALGTGQSLVAAGDVTKDGYSEKVVEMAVEKFGGIDDLILNAGFTWDAVVHKMSDAQWNTMLDVHLGAPFKMIRAAAPYMRDVAKREIENLGFAKGRSILTISSVSGVHGNAGQANYAAAKAGVVGLTRALAKEWGQFNIRANSVVLGHFKTRLTQDKNKGASIRFRGEDIKLGIPQGSNMSALMEQMIPLQRLGLPEEAAGAMLILTGPYASYITGQAIEITGGGWM